MKTDVWGVEGLVGSVNVLVSHCDGTNVSKKRNRPERLRDGLIIAAGKPLKGPVRSICGVAPGAEKPALLAARDVVPGIADGRSLLARTLTLARGAFLGSASEVASIAVAARQHTAWGSWFWMPTTVNAS